MGYDSNHLEGVTLIDGERVDSSVYLGSSGTDRFDRLVLTDMRLIRLGVKGTARSASFISIKDIAAVDVTNTRRRSVSGLAWGAVSLFVAVMVWRIWDHPLFSAVAAAVIAGMGVYLLVDRLWGYDKVRAVFSTESEEIRIAIDGADSAVEGRINAMANRLFELRDGTPATARRFAPR